MAGRLGAASELAPRRWGRSAIPTLGRSLGESQRAANRRVPKYLLGESERPDADPASYALGSEEEAVLCARALVQVWQSTADADQWLKGRVGAKKGQKRRR